MTVEGPRARLAGTSGAAFAVGALVLGAVLTGCTGQDGAASPRSTGAPSAGRYPVATPGPQVTSTPTATQGGYQLVAAGQPVRVVLDGADLVAQVSGPEVDLPVPAPGQPVSARSALGVLTVALTATSGSLQVPATGFLGLDEEQSPIALQPDAGSVQVSPGHPATLHLSSQFASGHTTLTWQPLGKPLVTWDFVVEID